VNVKSVYYISERVIFKIYVNFFLTTRSLIIKKQLRKSSQLTVLYSIPTNIAIYLQENQITNATTSGFIMAIASLGGEDIRG